MLGFGRTWAHEEDQENPLFSYIFSPSLVVVSYQGGRKASASIEKTLKGRVKQARAGLARAGLICHTFPNQIHSHVFFPIIFYVPGSFVFFLSSLIFNHCRHWSEIYTIGWSFLQFLCVAYVKECMPLSKCRIPFTYPCITTVKLGCSLLPLPIWD